jgi:transposase
MPESLPGLLRLGRNVIEILRSMNRQLVRMLETDPVLTDRVARLMTIPGVGIILALTWALEIGDVSRFPSIKSAISLLRIVRSGAKFELGHLKCHPERLG